MGVIRASPLNSCPVDDHVKVALVEREDFASGTSSRSTKLVHGGIRYATRLALSCLALLACLPSWVRACSSTDHAAFAVAAHTQYPNVCAVAASLSLLSCRYLEEAFLHLNKESYVL
jgi:hypothetical protein